MEPLANQCIDRLYSNASPVEIGYKLQSIAAHILMRMGYSIRAINATGHPDIVAISSLGVSHFEIEAEYARPRLRKLSEADFDALLGIPNVFGYYALGISHPNPHWIVVPASKLRDRSLPYSNTLLKALSDKEMSACWTQAYIQLLEESCLQIRTGTFERLRVLALNGQGL